MTFDFKFGLGRIQYAKGVYYRDELFEKAITQARGELAKAEEAGVAAGHPDYDSFVKAIEEAQVGKKNYKINSRLEDDKGFIERKIKYAKGQGIRFLDRVEKSHQEVRDKLEALVADPEVMEFGGEELKNYVEETKKGLEMYEKELKWAKVKDKLEDDKGWVERKVKDVKNHGVRFIDRAEKAQEEGNKRLDEMAGNEGYQEYDSTLQGWIDDKREEMIGFMNNFKGEKLQKELDSDFESIKRKLKYAKEQIPRFLDRAEASLKEVDDKLDVIFGEEKYFGIDLVEEFLAEHRPIARELGEEVRNLILGDLIKKGVWNCEHKLRMAFTDLEKYGLYQDRARGGFIEAQDEAQSLEDSHPEWTDAGRWYEFRDEFDTKCAEFEELYDQVSLKEDAKKAMEDIKNRFSFSSSYRVGSFDRALEYLVESKDLADQLRGNDRLSRLAEVDEFLNDFDDKWQEQKDSFDEEVLVGDLKKAISKALTPLSHASTYFKSGHQERALEYFEEAKDASDELYSEVRFLDRPELKEFSTQFDEQHGAFQQLYEDTVLKELKKKAIAKAETNLSHANTYFNSHHIGQSLEYLEEAKAANMEAMEEEKLIGVDGMSEFFEKMETGIAEFEKKILEHYLNEEKKAALGTAQSHTDWALSYLESHRDGQALEYRDQALGNLEEIEGNDNLAKLEDVKAAVEAMRKKIQEFDELYKEKVTRALFKRLTETALQHITNADIKLKSATYGQCMEELQYGKEKAGEVMGDSQLVSSFGEEVDSFEAKFNERLIDVEHRYNEEMINNNFRAKCIAVSQSFSYAGTEFEAERYDMALERFQEAKTARDDLFEDNQLQKERKEKVKAFVDDFDKRAVVWREEFTAKVLHKEVAAALAKANTNLSHANTYFESHRDGQALDYYENAIAAAGEVGVDERFEGLPQVLAFQQQFNQGAKNFKDKFAARRKTERIKEMRGKATTNISHAETYFDSHRRGQALAYLHQAREAVDEHNSDVELMAEKDAEQWGQDVNERITAFENKYTDTVFAEQLKKAKEGCTQQLTFAQQGLDGKDLKKASSSLEKARDAAAELGADEKFLRSEGVDEFLNSFNQQVAELKGKVQQGMDAEQRKSDQDKANTLLSHSETYFNSHHRSQGLDYLARARDALEDLKFDADTSDTDMQKFIEDFQQRLEKVSETFEKVLFAEEITNFQRSAEGYLRDAQFNAQTRQMDRALDLLQQAKEAAGKLGDERFFGCAEVTQFFEGWTKRITEFEEELQRALFSEAVKKVIDDAESRFRLATTFAKQKSYPRAMESLREAKRALSNLKNNPDFGETKAVVEFAGKFEEALKGLSEEINTELFRDQVEQRCRQATSYIQVAETLFNNHSVAQSLQQYQEGKREVEELTTNPNFSTHELAKKTTLQLTPRLEEFATSYARSQLVEKGRELLFKLSSGLEEVKRLERRGLGDAPLAREALARLAGVIADAEAGEDKGMLLQCEGVNAAVEKGKEMQVAYAERVYSSAVKKHIAQGERVVETVVKKHVERGFLDLAVSSFNSQVRDPFTSSLLAKEEEAAFVQLLPSFSEFVEKMENFAKIVLRGKTGFLAPKSRAEKGAGGARGGASGEPRSVLDVLGGKLEPEQPLKYTTIAMSVDINPKLYNYVKELNTLGGRLNTESRKAVREVQDMPFDEPVSLETVGHHYSLDIHYRENAGYPIESIVDLLKKVKRQVDGAVKELPDDPTTKKLKENSEEYVKRWEETYGKWKKLMELGAEVRSVLNTIDFANKCVDEGKECYGVNSNPNQLNLTHRALIFGEVQGLGGLGGFAPKLYDYDVFLFAIDRIEKTRKQIEEIAGRHNGLFPRRKKIEAQLDKVYKEARTIHPLHCIRSYIYTAGNRSNRDLYVTALRRFPLARAALKQRMAERKMNFYERRQHELANCDEDTWRVKDPFEDSCPRDRFEDETVEEYDLPYHVVVPGSGKQVEGRDTNGVWKVDDEPIDKSLPFADRSDQSTNKVYNNLRKEFAGKIVFSNSPIDQNVESSSEFSTEFDDPNAEIFGRAFWPRSLSNYALGVDKKTNKPLYGPENMFGSEHYMEFMMEVLVDGKKVAREGQPGEMFSYFRSNGPTGDKKSYRQGSQVDFWSFNQTCRLNLGLNQVDATDDWETAANRLRRVYKGLEKGKHEVEVRLRFRVCTTDDNLERKKPGQEIFPLHNTPISTPIATGKFTINIPDPSKVRLGKIYTPINNQCNLPRPAIAKTEQHIKRFLEESCGWGKRAAKTEVPTHVVLQGVWYVCSTAYFEVTLSRNEIKLKKEPTQYAIPCKAYFYRSPESGWEKETMVEFDLSGLAPETRNPKIGPPVVGVSVGRNGRFDVDLLPDEDLEKGVKKRCKKEWRQGTLFKDEKEQAYFKAVAEGVAKALEQCKK